jgi:NAD(P)-dependent dehydrogenase (short-subunit alcohol dehydrogenase family)
MYVEPAVVLAIIKCRVLLFANWTVRHCVLVSICAGGPVDNWRHVLDLNVLGLSICTKEAIESMKEKQVDGHIIHINRSVTLQSRIDITVTLQSCIDITVTLQ